MSPKHEQQHDSLRPQSGFRTTYTSEHRRTSSITSQGHRHEPYKTASRQSSISSLSGAMQGSDGASSDWQWESSAEPEVLSSSPLSNVGLSICPADLQVNSGAHRAQRSVTAFAAQVPLPKSEYGDEAEDSDAVSDMEPERLHSRKPRGNVPAPILPTTPAGKVELATATTFWSRSSGATRTSRNTKPHRPYREVSEVPDTPILVTAITSSGKKSHARKVSSVSLSHLRSRLTTLDVYSVRKTISLVHEMLSSCSENTSWTRSSFRPRWRSGIRTSRWLSPRCGPR